MINKINKKIKQFAHMIATGHQLQEDQMALVQLLKMFDDKLFLPLTSWSISPKEVLHFCNDIVINNRSNIIEFGSGFSTICIAQLLKITGRRATFTSVENNAAWAEEITAILKRMDLQDYVKVVYAPIADVPTAFAKEKQQKWYDTEIISVSLETIQTVDMIIVDGPYGGLTPHARFSAIPFLRSKIASDYAVFLDDTDRETEKKIAEDWHKSLGGRIKNYKRYTCLTNTAGFDVTPYEINYTL